ncbi:hypothetical protein ACJIZ3_003598 [Penstemon smallii]|uniref:Pentatricopeptide repeat-containing protein n=1 Tax=Penstemon smallii TaxID=265156 RepID=A0ABD3UB74_9LAMI
MAISCLCLSTTNLTVNSINEQHIRSPLNSTLKSLSKSGKLDEVLKLLQQPHLSKTRDLDSYATFLHTCISRKSIHHGRTLYLHLLESKDTENLLKNPILKSKFITLFSACGRLDEANRVF